MGSSKSKRIISYSEEYSPKELREIQKKLSLEKKLKKKEKKYKKQLEEKLTKELDEKIRKAKGRIAPISLSIPKGTPVIWGPNPGSQVRFLMCPYDEVLLEGNRGGGKTDCLLMDFCQHVNKGYGEAWRGILFRESYPQLADVIAKSKKWIPRMFPGSIYNKSDKTWTFPWGEQLLLRFMETPDDYENYHGHEFPWIGWEELTLWATPECYLIMMSCNRSSNPNVPRKYRSTCNPGGIGNQWVKARFIDIGPQMTVFTDDQGKKRCRITSRLDENKVLLKADPKYLNTLLSLTQDDPIKRKAWVKGSWDIIMGGALTDIWNNKVHVIPSFKFPKTWKVYRSFDYGSQKPWSVTYGAVSNGENPEDRYYPKDTVFIIAEIYGWNGQPNQGDGATSIEIAERVAEMDEYIRKEYGCRVCIGPADTSIWEVRDGKSIANSMNALGCRWTRAYKGAGSRVAGLAEIRQRLGAAKRGDVESPGLYFFDKTYHHVRTLTILPRDKNNNEDVDCFVAGTLVDTSNGKIPIEKLNIGDLIRTPLGFKKAIKTGIFRKAKTVSISLSNGKYLRGTLDHKVYVENIGLVPLCRLKIGDELCQRELSILEDSNLQVGTEVTLNVIQSIVDFLMERHYCTEQYGKNIMEKFQENLQYITKTTTNLTTELKILNLFIRGITQDTTLKEDLKKVGIYTKDLGNGENLQKVKKYLEIILKSAEIMLPNENLRALIVTNLLLQNKDRRYIALKNVEKVQFQEKLGKNVLFVNQFSGQKEIIKKKHKLVVTNVGGIYEEEIVYNLTTEQAHLYYANDCLVSNTSAEDHAYDGLRYLLSRKLAELRRRKVSI